MKIIITGSEGFVGSYLKKFYEKEDLYFFNKDDDKLIDKNVLREEVKRIQPDIVFHLAAQSSPAISWKQPYTTLNENITTTINLVSVVEEFKCKLVIAGSAEVYDTVNISEGNPLKESSFLKPRNPYGLSKFAIDFLIRMIAFERKINVTILRLFNHIGPKQSEHFVVSTFAKQLAEIKLGMKNPVIKVGNLEAKRDLLDVNDAIRAYHLVSGLEEYGDVYNVCSGKSYKIRDILEKLIKISGLDVEVVQDDDRMRPSDIPIFVGDYTKLKNKTGWEPTISLEKSLEDTYNYWISELQKGGVS